MEQYQEILDKSHLLNQKGFAKYFDNFVKKNKKKISSFKTVFIDPPKGDLKNSKINNYLSLMSKGKATDGNCNTVLEFFFIRYEEMKKSEKWADKLDDKYIKIKDLKKLIQKKIQVNERARIKSFDELWNIARTEPGDFLKSRIKWEDYENDLKENLTKISGQNWDYFRNKTKIHRHINRIIMQDFDEIADEETMKKLASLAGEIDSVTNAIDAKNPHRGSGDRMMGKWRAKDSFKKLKKVKVFFTTSFLTPVYSQIPNTPVLQITVNVIYRIFYSGLKVSQFKIDDGKKLKDIVPPVARDDFLKRFIRNLNLLSTNISSLKK